METTQNPSEQSSSERPYRNLREYTDQLHLWLYQYRMWNSMQSFSTMFPLMLNHCTGPQLSFPHNNNNNTATHTATIAPDSTTAANSTRRTTQFQNQRGKCVHMQLFYTNHLYIVYLDFLLKVFDANICHFVHLENKPNKPI